MAMLDVIPVGFCTKHSPGLTRAIRGTNYILYALFLKFTTVAIPHLSRRRESAGQLTIDEGKLNAGAVV